MWVCREKNWCVSTNRVIAYLFVILFVSKITRSTVLWYSGTVGDVLKHGMKQIVGQCLWTYQNTIPFSHNHNIPTFISINFNFLLSENWEVLIVREPWKTGHVRYRWGGQKEIKNCQLALKSQIKEQFNLWWTFSLSQLTPLQTNIWSNTDRSPGMSSSVYFAWSANSEQLFSNLLRARFLSQDRLRKEAVLNSGSVVGKRLSGFLWCEIYFHDEDSSKRLFLMFHLTCESSLHFYSLSKFQIVSKNTKRLQTNQD